jgi:hypothetical protein
MLNLNSVITLVISLTGEASSPKVSEDSQEEAYGYEQSFTNMASILLINYVRDIMPVLHKI